MELIQRASIAICLVIVFSLVVWKTSPAYEESGNLLARTAQYRYPFLPHGYLDQCNVPDSFSQPDGKLPSLVFVKTHKTAGSTIAAILNRIADGRRMNKVIPLDYIRLGYPERLLGPKSIRGNFRDKHHRKYDMIANHMIFDSHHVDKYIKKPYFLFTSLREPISQAISAFNWFGKHADSWDDHISYLTHIKVMKDHETPGNKYSPIRFHNSLAFDLGWYHKWDGSTKHDHDVDKIRDFIAELDDKLDFTLIVEHLDESLVLLSQLVPGLAPQELLYHNMKSEHEEMVYVYPTDKQTKRLERLLQVDVMIYQHFLQKFQNLWNSQPTSVTQDLLTTFECAHDHLTDHLMELPRGLLRKFTMDTIPYTKFLFQKRLHAERHAERKKHHSRVRDEDEGDVIMEEDGDEEDETDNVNESTSTGEDDDFA